jgi:hypothetical protein
MENSSLISDSEWNALISEVYGELFSEVAASIERYFESVATVTATGATSYDEPTDHLSTIRIARVDSSGRQCHLKELRSQDEVHFIGARGSDAAYWALVDDQLFLYPNPSSGSYKWYYLPQPPDLASYADGDLVDVYCPAGLKFLVWGVAAIALAKAESNSQLALQKQEQARDEVQYWAANRNLAEGKSRPIEDIEGSARFGPDGWERWP